MHFPLPITERKYQWIECALSITHAGAGCPLLAATCPLRLAKEGFRLVLRGEKFHRFVGPQVRHVIAVGSGRGQRAVGEFGRREDGNPCLHLIRP